MSRKCLTYVSYLSHFVTYKFDFLNVIIARIYGD